MSVTDNERTTVSDRTTPRFSLDELEAAVRQAWAEATFVEMIKGSRVRVEIDLEGVIEYTSKDSVRILFDDGRDVWLPKSFVEVIDQEPPVAAR